MDSPDAARHLRQGLDDSMAAMARGSDCSMDFGGVSKGPWIGALWDDLRKLITPRDNKHRVWSHLRMVHRETSQTISAEDRGV